MIRLAHGLMGLLAIAIISLSGASAEAQMKCDLRDNAISHLAEKFDEHVVGRGLTRGGRSMVEILVSESGSWSALVTDTNGRTCLMATGEDWTEIQLLVGDPV
jgi:hypothetical protein